MRYFNDIYIQNGSGVYAIICLANDKMYIGSSARIRSRLSSHFGTLKRGVSDSRILQNAYNKYGEANFVCCVLDYCDQKDLVKTEQLYLDIFQSYDDQFGYNIRRIAESNHGNKRTPEMKEAQRLRTLGTKMSEESKNKRRENWRINHDKWMNEANDTRGHEFDVIAPDGTRHTGKGIARFARQHGLVPGSFNDLIKGDISILHGWHLPDRAPKCYRFLDPWKKEYTIQHGGLKSFCQERGLSYTYMVLLWSRKQSHHKDWCRFDRRDLYVDLLGPNKEQVSTCILYRTHFVNRYQLGASGVSALMQKRVRSNRGWTFAPKEVPLTVQSAA